MKEGLGSGREGVVGSIVLRINKIYVSFFSVNLLITEIGTHLSWGIWGRF